MLIFDGAPQSNKATLEVAKAAQLVIIPTGLSVDDLHPSVILANSLKAEKIPAKRISFALCRTGDSQNELTEAQDYLQATPYPLLPGQVQERTAYRRAQDAGRSLAECQYAKPREQAQALVTAIAARINELTN